MKDVMYCIMCESWEPVINGGHIIYLPPFEDEPAEIDWCDGPFAWSEPPETAWEGRNDTAWMDEPCPEELEQINQEAELIMEVD